MDTADGGRATEFRFLGGTMEIDHAGVGVDFSALVPTRFQAFQPQGAVEDGGIGSLLPGIAGGASGLEYNAAWPASAMD